MNRVTLGAAALLLAFSFHGALAKPAEKDSKSVEARITETIQSRFPEAKVVQVRPARELPGWYEVVTENEIVYTNATAELLIAGRIMDTRTRIDLTTQRWEELHRIDFDALPLDLAIKTVKGNGSRRLAVFADPDCPFCKQLEQNIREVSDVTIYTFLYPLENLHPDARAKAVKIWCSPERAAVWSKWMVDGVAPEADKCEGEPTTRLIELGKSLKVNATPTLFFVDGGRFEGMMTREQFEQRISGAKSVAQVTPSQ